MQRKIITLIIIAIIAGTVSITVLYAQNELNANIAAAKQLRFILSGGGVSSLFINYPASDATLWFSVSFYLSNPSSKSLTVPPFNLVVYMDNNKLGNVTTSQSYYLGQGLASSSTLTLKVQSSQLPSPFKDTFFNIADDIWNDEKPSVNLRVTGTAIITVTSLFLSATVPVPVDVNKTINLLKP